MSPRLLPLGLLAAILILLPRTPARSFSLRASGAVTLSITSDEARFGHIPAAIGGDPTVTIALGTVGARGSLTLSTWSSRVLSEGQYPIRGRDDRNAANTDFKALFVAGSAEHPRGVFRGESGWLTITRAEAGWLWGTFELRARGFLAVNVADENQWVTLRGSFVAQGDK